MWAINAAGQSVESWNKPNGNPRTFLESLQDPSGYFKYNATSGEQSLSASNTAHAVIALQGSTLPLNIYNTLSTGFQFTIQGSAGVICQGQTQGPSALAIVRNASTQCGFSYVIRDTSFGPYLEQIGNDQASGINGWQYKVNNIRPSIGAADYILQNNDSVFWYFGSASQTSDEIMSQVVDLSVTIERDQVAPPPQRTISFIIAPTSVNLGTLRPGGSASTSITAANNGNVDLDITADVGGDSVFVSYLKIGASSWQLFASRLNGGDSQVLNLNISLPETFSGVAGARSGQIIFWATPR